MLTMYRENDIIETTQAILREESIIKGSIGTIVAVHRNACLVEFGNGILVTCYKNEIKKRENNTEKGETMKKVFVYSLLFIINLIGQLLLKKINKKVLEILKV